MSKIVATLTMLLVVLLVPTGVFAQSNGSIYGVLGAPVPIFFNFSVSGSTFVVTILTFGNGGNGRWFAAHGTTDGVNGAGPLIVPSGSALTEPPNNDLTFTLDQPNGLAGSFATRGLGGLLSLTSGRFVRIFP